MAIKPNIPNANTKNNTNVPFFPAFDFHANSPMINNKNKKLKNKKETKAFIKAKVDEIERFKDEESWWEPKEINAGTSFFCQNLCGFSNKCQAFQDYMEMKTAYEESKIEKEADNELAKFI